MSLLALWGIFFLPREGDSMFSRFLVSLLRLLLNLRYRLKIQGLEKVQRGKRGVLVLPNHPAEIDPLILMALLWPKLRFRPLVLEKYYYLRLALPFMRLARAIPIPDMTVDAGNFKRRRMERALKQVVQGLKDGDNILFYPAGSLMKSGLERLQGSSGVSHVLKGAPEAEVLLVRSRGLWGSIFSQAFSPGVSPDFPEAASRALLAILQNAIFFLPRRDVSIEMTWAGEGLPRHSDALSLNRYLEGWYNKKGEEEASLVSYSFWRRKIMELPKAPELVAEEEVFSESIVQSVKQVLAEASNAKAEDIRLEQRLGEDLGLDSLAIGSLLLWLDEKYGVSDVSVLDLSTVRAVCHSAAGGCLRHDAEQINSHPLWTKGDRGRPLPRAPEGLTLQEAFFRQAARMRNYCALADERSGIVRWRRLKLGVLALATLIRRFPEERIGIMLPSSVGAALSILAVLIAKKTPVMVNWTSGRRNVEHALTRTGVQRIITAEAFLDRVEADLSYLDERFVFLEEIRRDIGLGIKLRAFLQGLLWPTMLLRFLALSSVKEEDTAVILFTSGSEAAPKAVPLTHRNILSNIQASLEIVEFRPDDVILSILPPFHSFGLTVVCLLPILCGLRVAFYPNPTEGRKIANCCARYCVTLLAGTPTFLKGVLRAAGAEKLGSISIFLTGAEKAPEDLFRMVERLGTGAMLLEGYGITECSPIVSGTYPHEKRIGVGRPLSGVELLIVHHESYQPLPEGQRGLVLIHGDNVFSGYLGETANPFIELQGKRWYNSGDLGWMAQGSLVLAGRLKRFVKIAGEMISLPAIEEALAESYPPFEDKPSLAVIEHQAMGQERAELILFCSLALEASEANNVLRQAGFPSLVRISEVRRLSEIPILGSGKVDLQALKAMLEKKS